ncbi:MAG: hypothetical protein Q4C13_03270 [Clostridia bacterium]|nr:hypothetical protein [Clostridia bacterium]
MKQVQLFLAHCSIVFGTVFIVLLALNMFNSSMQFLAGAVTKWFLLLFCLSAIFLGICTIVLSRRARRAQLVRRQQRQGGRTPYKS